MSDTNQTPGEIKTFHLSEWRKENPEKAAEANKKAAQTRHRRAEMRKEAQFILSAELLNDDEIAQELKDLGYGENSEFGNPTYQTAMLYGMMKKAVYNQDVEAAKFIRDTSGQKPVDGMAIGTLDDKPLEINLSSYSDEQLLELIARSQEEE